MKARDEHGRFLKGKSGNLHGRPFKIGRCGGRATSKAYVATDFARETDGRFAKGNSGNKRGRPRTQLQLFPNGKVYILWLKGTNYVKIGYSENVLRRIRALEGCVPYEIVPLAVLDGDVQKEIDLQTRFKKDHVKGEWFIFSQDIRNYISRQNSLLNRT